MSQLKPLFPDWNENCIRIQYNGSTFYSPKYNVPQPEYKKPDLRTTIHWEPNMVNDEEGNAIISFYNADNWAKIIVDV